MGIEIGILLINDNQNPYALFRLFNCNQDAPFRQLTTTYSFNKFYFWFPSIFQCMLCFRFLNQNRHFTFILNTFRNEWLASPDILLKGWIPTCRNEWLFVNDCFTGWFTNGMFRLRSPLDYPLSSFRIRCIYQLRIKLIPRYPILDNELNLKDITIGYMFIIT